MLITPKERNCISTSLSNVANAKIALFNKADGAIAQMKLHPKELYL